jgi:hypothetical protein
VQALLPVFFRLIGKNALPAAAPPPLALMVIFSPDVVQLAGEPLAGELLVGDAGAVDVLGDAEALAGELDPEGEAEDWPPAELVLFDPHAATKAAMHSKDAAAMAGRAARADGVMSGAPFSWRGSLACPRGVLTLTTHGHPLWLHATGPAP